MKRITKNLILIFDFDSTFIKSEALEVIAEIALDENPEKALILQQIQEITILGMEGKIQFRDSITQRLALLSLNKKIVKDAIVVLINNVSDSIVKYKTFFKRNANHIHILSGGFTDIISPVVKEYGILPKNIHAINLKFKDNEFAGIDKDSLLLEPQGKAKLIRSLNLHGRIIMVGDGYTDFEVKQAGAADTFIAYCENVKRDSVILKADYIANNIDDVISFIE